MVQIGIKVKNILENRHTVYCNANNGITLHNNGTTSITESIMTLRTILFTLSLKYKEAIMKLQGLGYGTDEYKEKKKEFPCWMPSGTFEWQKSNDNAVTSYSNLISIDIDKQDNDINLADIRKQIYDLPYVIAVLKSISGEGLYALVLVEDGRCSKEYYEYIAKLWNYKFKLNIDPVCKNIGRKRFISYDSEINEWLKNDETEIIPWKLKLQKQIEETKPVSVDLFNKTNEDYKTNLTHNAIRKIIQSGYYVNTYCGWYNLGCELANFDDGKELFILASRNYTLKHDSDAVINKKWDSCKPSGIDDELHRKWQGMAKNRFGNKWWKV